VQKILLRRDRIWGNPVTLRMQGSGNPAYGRSRFFPVVTIACLLSACGGGGGGSSDGPDVPSPTPTTLSFTIDKPSVNVGESATLLWSSNGTSCSATGDWPNGARQSNGNESTGVQSTAGQRTYTLACTGDGGPKSVTVTLEVTSPVQPAIKSFNLDKAAIKPGESATLTWNSENTTRCQAGGAWSGNKGITGSESTQVRVNPGAHSFTLTCFDSNNASSTATKQLTVAGASVTDTNIDDLAKLACAHPLLRGLCKPSSRAAKSDVSSEAVIPKATSQVFCPGAGSGTQGGTQTFTGTIQSPNSPFAPSTQFYVEQVVHSNCLNTVTGFLAARGISTSRFDGSYLSNGPFEVGCPNGANCNPVGRPERGGVAVHAPTITYVTASTPATTYQSRAIYRDTQNNISYDNQTTIRFRADSLRTSGHSADSFVQEYSGDYLTTQPSGQTQRIRFNGFYGLTGRPFVVDVQGNQGSVDGLFGYESPDVTGCAAGAIAVATIEKLLFDTSGTIRGGKLQFNAANRAWQIQYMSDGTRAISQCAKNADASVGACGTPTVATTPQPFAQPANQFSPAVVNFTSPLGDPIGGCPALLNG